MQICEAATGASYCMLQLSMDLIVKLGLIVKNCKCPALWQE